MTDGDVTTHGLGCGCRLCVPEYTADGFRRLPHIGLAAVAAATAWVRDMAPPDRRPSWTVPADVSPGAADGRTANRVARDRARRKAAKAQRKRMRAVSRG